MKNSGFFSDKIDLCLIVCSILASIIGIIAINSASAMLSGHLRYVIVQSAAFLIGLIAMTLVIFFRYTYLEKLKYIVFFIGIGLLVLVLAIGKFSHGTQGWISLGPVMLQPSEIAKICFIITISQHITEVREKLNEPRKILMLCLHFLCYAVPILLQPDFGTATVFGMIFVFMLFFAGIGRRYIFGAAGLIAVSSPVIWFLLKDYQRNRIFSFLSPQKDPTGSGYHVLQSELAIGSGQIIGRGYMSGPQTQSGYLPERQTDFIFSVIGEEFGFIGSIAVTVILLLIVYRCFDNAQSCSHDSLGELICVGVGSMLFFHIVENIGMCIGLLPITGIPLPFISYGGSNLVTCFIATGLVQSIRMRRRAVKFNI